MRLSELLVVPRTRPKRAGLWSTASASEGGMGPAASPDYLRGRLSNR